MSNGHDVLDTMVNSSTTMINNTLNINTSTNLLTGGTNDILTGLGTGAASNLIEALFQSNSHHELQQKHQQQHPHLHHQQPQQQQHQEQHQPQMQPDQQQYQSQKLYSHFNHMNMKTAITKTDMHIGSNTFANNAVVSPGCHPSSESIPSSSMQHNIVSNHNDGRNATYAAVLSHGHHQQGQRSNNQDMNCADGFNVVDGVGMGTPAGQNVNLRRENNPNQTTSVNGGEKDLFAALRELGQGTNGFYNYFQ